MKLYHILGITLFALLNVFVCLNAQEAEKESTQTEEKTPPEIPDIRFIEMEAGPYVVHQFEVTEERGENSYGVSDALELFIPGGEKKVIEKEWKKYLKPYGGKLTNTRGEMISQGAEIANVSSKSLDVIAYIDEAENGAILTSFFYLHESFIDSESHPNEFLAASGLLKDFGHRYHQMLIENEYESEQREMKKLRNEGERLVRENDNLYKDIERYKKLIREAEEDLKKNEEEQIQNGTAVQGKEIDLQYVEWKRKSY